MKGLQGPCKYFSLCTDHKASERGVASSRFSLPPTASCKDWKGDPESTALVEDSSPCDILLPFNGSLRGQSSNTLPALHSFSKHFCTMLGEMDFNASTLCPHDASKHSVTR